MILEAFLLKIRLRRTTAVSEISGLNHSHNWESLLIAIDFFVLNHEYQILSPAEMDWSTSVFRR